jgi:Flp pilus assembly protein TadG
MSSRKEPDGKTAMTRYFENRSKRRLRDANGNSIIEAALIMPILMMVTFGIVDFGILFYKHLALESAVSQAVRYGITGNTGGAGSRQDAIKAVLRGAAPTLTIKDNEITFSRLAGGNWVNGLGGPGDVERLSVNVTHKVLILAPFFRPNGQITLHAESAMKNEDRFQ